MATKRTPDFLLKSAGDPYLSTDVTMFIPGFGVNKFGSPAIDSEAAILRCALLDIMPRNHTTVLTELQNYDSADNKISYPLTFEEQASRLTAVMSDILKFPKLKRINIIAQSIGCLALIPMLNYLTRNCVHLHRLSLWAPPTFEDETHSLRIARCFLPENIPFTDHYREVILPGKEGKMIHVSDSYWNSLRKYKMVENLYDITAVFRRSLLIFASHDKLYPHGISYYAPFKSNRCFLFEIPGSSHTFRPPEMCDDVSLLMKKHFFT